MRADDLPRHALEIRALTEPEQVLTALPSALAAAEKAGDFREQALLELAHANACRVIANWVCQRDAGQRAQASADAVNEPILAIRGVVAEARGAIALQDYSRGERILSTAEARLKKTPSPDLSADVSLAYSSFSHSIGKYALSKTYAERGLKELGALESPPMRARLLRNKARAQALLGDTEAARETLKLAIAVADRMFDPKLSAEMHIEAARIARQLGDVPEQRRSAERILAFAKDLKNSQLAGLGHEVMGLSAVSEAAFDRAHKQLTVSLLKFRELNLNRDEMRVIRELLELSIQRRADAAELSALIAGYLRLEREVTEADRAQAADDFDARLSYAEAEINVARLEAEATLARERESASAQRASLRGLAASLAVLAIIVLAGFFVQQRKLNRRLRLVMAKQRESETRAVELLELTDGFVLLHDLNGALLMVNPAVSHALGGSAATLVGRMLADFAVTEARAEFVTYLQQLRSSGRAEGTRAIRHGDGSVHHWRYSARMSLPSEGSIAYAIVNAVDITEQVEESSVLREQSLRDALTRAYNRRFLGLFESGQAPGAHWAVVVLDLDRFKQINDALGHAQGDLILLETAEMLRAHAPADGAVVRLGGDEFALLLANADESRLIALSNTLQALAPSTRCRYTIGHAIRIGEETLARADSQMYRSRERARAQEAS